MHYNIKTNAKRTRLPSVLVIDGQIIRDPKPEQYEQAGWRPFVPATIPDGMQVTSSEISEDEDGIVRETVGLEPIPPRVPDARLLAIAGAYRTTLRGMYGDDAEVNREVTRQKVEDDLLAMAVSGNADAVRSAIILERGFEAITLWTGSTEAWSFFENHGDLI